MARDRKVGPRAKKSVSSSEGRGAALFQNIPSPRVERLKRSILSHRERVISVGTYEKKSSRRAGDQSELSRRRIANARRMEPDSGKQYSLRWEKHAFNLASEAGCFFEDESFLDCTLSAEGQCIEAHKIILSAASSYLSNLLKITPDKHPILIFNDIKFEQLKSLVAFIYNGSVNISENNIHAFLNAAQSLLIKGLSEGASPPPAPASSQPSSQSLPLPFQDSRHEERTSEGGRKPPRSGELAEVRTNCRKHQAKVPMPKKPETDPDCGRSFKKQRQISPRRDGPQFAECEESLSKLQEISITKYIQQNLNAKAHGRSELSEGKWNGPVEEKLRGAENYVVKSWKHNSVEDLNGRHKQNKTNSIKRIKLEKLINSRNEEPEPGDRRRASTEFSEVSGFPSDRMRPEEAEEKIKKEMVLEPERMVLVEPKQEIIEEEDTNSEDYHLSNNEPITPDSESLYETRSLSNYHHPPLVEKGIPVPLLMCRTSLSEPDSAESNWIPTPPNSFPPPANPLENNSQDLHCRTCSQDLPCPTCTKKYKSRYALNRHILYECGKARKSFSCDECGKKVTRQDTLQKHKLIHLVQHLKKKENEVDDELKSRKSC